MSDNEKREFTTEEEGQLVKYLREFVMCEDDHCKAPILERLRDLTGIDRGDSPGGWFSWYFGEHMGIQSIIERVTDSSGEEDRGEVLESEYVFEQPEYNWCALDKIKNKDDMQKLRMLYSDLESPISISISGPFSFHRLSGADESDLGYFCGKTLTQAIFDENVEVRHLRILKDYGKMMMSGMFPGATQRAGTIIYISAISRCLVKFDAKITSLSYQDLKECMPGLLQRPYLTERFCDLFRQALSKCG